MTMSSVLSDRFGPDDVIKKALVPKELSDQQLIVNVGEWVWDWAGDALPKYQFDPKPDEDARKFQKDSRLYDEDLERWHGLPRGAAHDNELYKPFSRIFQQPFQDFGYPSRGQVFLETHTHTDIWTQDGNITPPTFMIMGALRSRRWKEIPHLYVHCTDVVPPL